MFYSYRPSDFMRRTLALAVVLGAGAAVAGAQTNTVSAQPADAQSAPALNFQAPTFDTSHASLFSSSTDSTADTTQVASVSGSTNPFVNAMQYGGRRYGRPRYRGGNTNQDGSPKYGFLVGAGVTAPITDDSSYLKDSYAFQVGAGRNFNKMVGVMLQFDWDNFGFTGKTISNQASVYFGDPANSLYGLDGNSHIWSFTLNPTFSFYESEGLGAYFVVGGGFYHKAAKFFVPVAAQGYDPYYGPYTYAANETVQNYSSNSAGVNGGVGITYKPSRFSGERLYGEVRVVHTFNNYKPGITVNTPAATAAAYSGWNYFPQNSVETTYLPIKVGIRF